VDEAIELPRNQGAIRIRTGILHRADGRPLVRRWPEPGIGLAAPYAGARAVVPNRGDQGEEPVDPGRVQPDELVKSTPNTQKWLNTTFSGPVRVEPPDDDAQLRQAMKRLMDRL
jgi:hypothetical protein